MLEQTDAVTNEVLEPITFVLAYPTIYTGFRPGDTIFERRLVLF